MTSSPSAISSHKSDLPVWASNFPPLWDPWQASELKEMQTWSNLSSFRYSCLTLISYMPWCHRRICLNVNGGYVEIWCISSSTHVSCIHWNHNDVHGVRVFITIFLLKFHLLCWRSKWWVFFKQVASLTLSSKMDDHSFSLILVPVLWVVWLECLYCNSCWILHNSPVFPL